MPLPRRTCVKCGEEFELKPDKPGFANRCPECSMEDEEASASTTKKTDAVDRRSQREQDEERRKAIRDLLYRKDQ